MVTATADGDGDNNNQNNNQLNAEAKEMVATATATATATVTETASSGSSGGRLAAGCGSSSKQNAIADTCFLCCFLVRKLNVCYTWHRMPPEFRPEFLSPEFRTK